MLANFLETYKYWRYFAIKAFIVLQLKYKQSLLGMLWEPFALVFITFSISLIWSKVLQESSFLSFFLYLFIGYYIWMLISSLVHEGVNVFEKFSVEITNENRSLYFYILENIAICFSKFFIAMPVFMIIVIVFCESDVLISWSLFLLGVALILLSAVGFIATFGTISLLYNDVKHVIQSIMRLSFLLTPIIWHPERLGDSEKYIWLNPFYVYIRLCRDGFINNEVNLLVVSVAVIQTSVLLMLGGYLTTRYSDAIKRRIFSL